MLAHGQEVPVPGPGLACTWDYGSCSEEGISGGGRIEGGGESQAQEPERLGPHPSPVSLDQCGGFQIVMES